MLGDGVEDRVPGDEMADDLVPVEKELGGHHHRDVPPPTPGDQVAEALVVDEGPPLLVIEPGIDGSNVHGWPAYGAAQGTSASPGGAGCTDGTGRYG